MSTVARYVALVLLLITNTAFAQTRTWVSGVGNDADACSRTAPCKTFAGALSKTAAGGEISVLDSAGYGAVTITKSITIDGGNAHASILAAGVTGIIVNGADVRVTLRRLSINGFSDGGTAGPHGIRFLNGKELHVEDSVIANFSDTGIKAEGDGNLHVSGTTIRNVTGVGILVQPPSGTPKLTVEDSRIVETGIGVYATGATVGAIDDTTISDGTVGIAIEGTGELFVHDTTITHHEVAVRSAGGAVVSTEGLTAVANLATFMTETGGQIVPFTGALVTGNPPGGAATCDVASAAESVACLDSEVTCPAPVCPEPVCPEPVCPQPSCPAPVASLGDCKKCKQKGTTMICRGCGIDIE